MEYFQLNLENIKTFLGHIQEVTSLIPDLEDASIEEIGDGNINYVYRIQGKENSVILKQAVPYLRVLGESYPLTRERMNFEIMALKKHKELCPDSAPEIYYDDVDMSCVVMQDLKDCKIARQLLIEGTELPYLGKHMGKFLANTLFYTSDLYLDSKDKKAMAKKLINHEAQRYWHKKEDHVWLLVEDTWQTFEKEFLDLWRRNETENPSGEWQ